jgi:hypothetical protein
MSTRREICEHLRPLADALAAAHIAVEPTESPYGGDGTWWKCSCTFDEPALRARLSLDPCVTYDEYDGRTAGADATFSCMQDHTVFIGPHPSWVAAGTPRLK